MCACGIIVDLLTHALTRGMCYTHFVFQPLPFMRFSRTELESSEVALETGYCKACSKYSWQGYLVMNLVMFNFCV